MSPQQGVPQVGANHYSALCAFFLAVILLSQLRMGLLLLNAFAVMAGALALVYRLRLGPVLLVLLVAGAQLSLHVGLRGNSGIDRREGAMQLNDMVLCVAVLGYVIGHYRLQAVWYHILPTDVRLRSGAPRRVFPWIRRQTPIVKEKRPAHQITAAEIAWLVATLPVWAVVAQLAWSLVPQQWQILELGARFLQILLVSWLLGIGFWTAGTLFSFWKHRRHGPATAQLYLQDLLWRDTRGEQRRVNRWLAWWKLARKKEA